MRIGNGDVEKVKMTVTIYHNKQHRVETVDLLYPFSPR
jgi:hypothetical protein